MALPRMAGRLSLPSSTERFLAAYPIPDASGVKPADVGTVVAGGTDVVVAVSISVLVIVVNVVD